MVRLRNPIPHVITGRPLPNERIPKPGLCDECAYDAWCSRYGCCWTKAGVPEARDAALHNRNETRTGSSRSGSTRV